MTAQSNFHNREAGILDASLFNRITSGNASISETREYFAILKGHVDRGDFQNPQYNLILDQYFLIEQILDGLGLELPSEKLQTQIEFQANTPVERLERSYSRQKTIKELGADILAAASSENFKLALTKVAAANNLNYELVESIAKSLLQDRGLERQHDIDKVEYVRLVDQIREIELKLEDPGEKEFKLLKIAREHRLSLGQMQQVYFKSLISQQISPPINDQELEHLHPGTQKWLMRGWIPKGAVVLFHAQGGLGKTLFVQHLIKKIAQGADWGEHKVEQGSILYIQTDTAPIQLKEWLRQSNIFGQGLPIKYHLDWQIEWMAQLYQWIKEAPPALVVIDSLSTVNRHSLISENDVLYAKPILQIRDIAKEFNVAFFLIHHSNGAGQVRGTKALRNAADAVWSLEAALKDPSDSERILTMEKFRARALKQYRIKLNDDDFSWDLLEQDSEDGQPAENSSARFLIVNHLSKHQGIRFGVIDLAQALLISEPTVRRELPALAREGLIDRELNPKFIGGRSKGESRHLYMIS